jgi:hypothetical protein
MDAPQVIEKLEAGLIARRAFSEPIERDGSIVLLAAKVRGRRRSRACAESRVAGASTRRST